MRLQAVTVACLAMAVMSCKEPAGPAGALGKFDPAVADVQLLADGRRARLLKDFTYVDGAGKRWTAPTDEEVDGASIPQVFWSIIGGPYEGRFRFASIVHDRYCSVHDGQRWQDVHRMFYEACLAGGTDPQTAKLMYAAVYHFGPRWGDESKGMEQLAELIPPERARVASELQAWQLTPPNRASGHGAATRASEVRVLTQEQYRNLVLAPRRRPRALDVNDSPVPPSLEKWDRVREVLRDRPDAGLEELERVQ